MFAMAEMTYQVMSHHLKRSNIFALFRYPFQFHTIPYIYINCTMRMNCVVRANRADVSSVVLTYSSPTKSTMCTPRSPTARMICERDAMVMTIDVYDARKADTISMDDKIALDTYIRFRVVAFSSTTLASKRDLACKKTKWVLVSLGILNNKRWWMFSTTKAHIKVANRTMIKHLWSSCTKITTLLGFFSNFERVTWVTRMIHLFREMNTIQVEVHMDAFKT